MKCISPEEWIGCYSGTFDLISSESMAHPAKMSPSLCFKIIEHLEEMGLLKKGMTILDPMAGTGMTAICANFKGYRAITVELEEKFIGFQQKNKEYAGRKLYRELDWEIIQGDSRYLSKILTEKGLVSVFSPPYGHQESGERGFEVDPRPGRSYKINDAYSEDPNQIGNLPDKPLTIVSPPYTDSDTTHQCNNSDRFTKNKYLFQNRESPQSEGQISKLPDKPIAITSPPYEKAQSGGGIMVNGYTGNKHTPTDLVGKRTYTPENQGIADGQISNETAESYLDAMMLVYSEIAKVSDVLVVVTKNPTRNGQLRRLDLDTIELLKQTGWTIHCVHKAMLFREHEVPDLFGETHKKVKGRLSFFKRLSYQKGGVVAQWEDVIVAVKNKI